VKPQPPEHPEGGGCCDPNSKKIDWLFWGGLGVTIWAILWSTLDDKILSSTDQVASSISHTTHEMIWGILVGVVIVGILEHIPKEAVGAVIGSKQGWRGIFRAMVAGLFLDLCNHGILLIGMGLYRRGASLGQVFAFLVASPWNSFSLTLLLGSLIGVPWTIGFVLGSAAMAFVAGILADHWVNRGDLPENPNKSSLPEVPDWKGIRADLAKMDISPFGILKMIWTGAKVSKMLFRWLFLGTIMTALIQVYVPMDWYKSWFGPSEIGLLMTLLAATVIEVCSEGSVPIAADLFLRAQAPGNAFTFLMAGASTDMTEMLALRQTTGSWKSALLLPILTVPQILLISWVMNHFHHP
jgi:uncharacterized membrane protein YraQ (UPF0718 family)